MYRISRRGISICSHLPAKIIKGRGVSLITLQQFGYFLSNEQSKWRSLHSLNVIFMYGNSSLLRHYSQLRCWLDLHYGVLKHSFVRKCAENTYFPWNFCLTIRERVERFAIGCAYVLDGVQFKCLVRYSHEKRRLGNKDFTKFKGIGAVDLRHPLLHFGEMAKKFDYVPEIFWKPSI